MLPQFGASLMIVIMTGHWKDRKKQKVDAKNIKNSKLIFFS
jgi:hypothetical protein